MNAHLIASGSQVTVNLNGSNSPSSTVVVIVAITLLAVAPSLIILMTGFTRIFVVLGLTRNALGLQNVPPNQVLAGLALFLSLFVMAPTIHQVDTQAVQPYTAGKISISQAITKAEGPVKTWMARQTRSTELSMLTQAAHEKATTPDKASFTVLVPAFVLSELKSAFIIGFVIFIPFMVIDLVVSAVLMSMGMFMLPPTLVSLPFKLLLFVLVDGWTLVVHSLLVSFNP